MLSHALINHTVLRKAVLFLVASSNRAINLLARAELHLSVNTATASATSHNVAHWQATSAAPARTIHSHTSAWAHSNRRQRHCNYFEINFNKSSAPPTLSLPLSLYIYVAIYLSLLHCHSVSFGEQLCRLPGQMFNSLLA